MSGTSYKNNCTGREVKCRKIFLSSQIWRREYLYKNQFTWPILLNSSVNTVEDLCLVKTVPQFSFSPTWFCSKVTIQSSWFYTLLPRTQTATQTQHNFTAGLTTSRIKLLGESTFKHKCICHKILHRRKPKKKNKDRESFLPCCKCPPLENPSVIEAYPEETQFNHAKYDLIFDGHF